MFFLLLFIFGIYIVLDITQLNRIIVRFAWTFFFIIIWPLCALNFSGENGNECVTRTTNYRITYKFSSSHTTINMWDPHYTVYEFRQHNCIMKNNWIITRVTEMIMKICDAISILCFGRYTRNAIHWSMHFRRRWLKCDWRLILAILASLYINIYYFDLR